MTEITLEQRKKLDKLGMKFLLKSLWTGAHHGLMAIVMNLIFFMFLSIYHSEGSPIMTIGSIAIGFFIIRRVIKIQQEDFLQLKKDVEKIIKN